MTDQAPDRIYLQVDEPEVSWCADKIHDTDVEYVRVKPPQCAIYEYGGSFKCVTHDRVWGAIKDPDEPCPTAPDLKPKPGGGWRTDRRTTPANGRRR